MIINAPRQEDIPALQQLWQEAFGDSMEFIEDFFATGFSGERCLCLHRDGRPVAALYWFDCALEGKKLAYLYAIATEKAYRGRGLCRQLMEATHERLKALGYAAAVLVPAGEKLFSMYAAMGYRGFCPMQSRQIEAKMPPVPVKSLTARQYFGLRRQYLPEKGILQDSAAGYLATFAEFYEAEGAILCASREEAVLYVQEFLGDEGLLPGVITALGAQKARLRLPGGESYAMYLSLSGEFPEDAYLGLSLG